MRALIAAAIAALLLLVIQLIPVSITNPPASRDIPVPAGVGPVLDRGCYDCHSDRTRWPWYTRVAPVSWLVAHDVRDGRKHLNFSTWDVYAGDPGTAAEKLKKLAKATSNGSMPPWYYAIVHPECRLSSADRKLIADWAAREALAQESAGDSAAQ